MNEALYMPALCSSWVMGRGRQCGKRGSAKYKKEFDAFFNGAFVALRIADVLTAHRIDQFFYLAMVDRLDNFVWEQHEKYEAQERAAEEVVVSVIAATKKVDA